MFDGGGCGNEDDAAGAADEEENEGEDEEESGVSNRLIETFAEVDSASLASTRTCCREGDAGEASG